MSDRIFLNSLSSVLRGLIVFFLMIRRPPRSTLDRSSAASDVYKRQALAHADLSGFSLFEEAQYRGVRAAERILLLVDKGGS